jgi:hypothetical protein
LSNSESFQTRRLENFDRTYKALVKSHYRKNRQARADFEKRVAGIISLLRSDPRPPPPFGGLERWPKGSYQEGWELRKLHFGMPGLRGASGEGRLIYMVDTDGATVYLVWIYTHDEFPTRPPDKPLRQLAEEALREAEERE